MSRFRLSLAGMRIAYYTPHPCSASQISDLAKGASAWKTKCLPRLCCCSICGGPVRNWNQSAAASFAIAKKNCDPFYEMTPLRTAYRISSGTLWRLSLLRILLL